MLCVWVHGCDSGRVSDGSRLALYQTLSLSSALLLSFPSMSIFALLFLSFCRFCLVFVVFFSLSLELCRCSSDLFLSSRPRTGLVTTHITLGMVETRSVDVKKTTNIRF